MKQKLFAGRADLDRKTQTVSWLIPKLPRGSEAPGGVRNRTVDFEGFGGLKFRAYRDPICATKGPTNNHARLLTFDKRVVIHRVAGRADLDRKTQTVAWLIPTVHTCNYRRICNADCEKTRVLEIFLLPASSGWVPL